VAAASKSAGPFVARLVGPPGLALEVFRQLLESVGVVIVDPDDPNDLVTCEPDVVALVEPTREQWAAVRGTGVPIVLVQGEETDDADVVESVLAGADAVLHCDSDPETVLTVMTEVSRGGSVLGPAQVRAVAGVARAAGAQPGVTLSRRETEILLSITEGKAVKQTARDLGISPKTVENLQGRLFRKLGARNRAQAVARAHALGLLQSS
jgi:DNA-binding NarL/FixJ family response regulator